MAPSEPTASLCHVCRELNFSHLLTGDVRPEDDSFSSLANAIPLGPRSALKRRAVLGCAFCKLCVYPPPKPGWEVYPYRFPGWDEKAMEHSQTYLIPGRAHVRVHYEPLEQVRIFGKSHVNVHLLDARHSKFRALPPEVDVELIRSWLEDCLKSHQMCKKEMSPENFRPGGFLAAARAWVRDSIGWQRQAPPLNKFFRLIDVGTSEVVDTDPSSPVEYATLSYVWGSAQHVKPPSFSPAPRKPGRKPENRVPLPQPMPATVAAALQLTSDLGIDYLWVDSICINQADEAEKLVQLRNMAAIYSRAIVCIVAAVGDHADSGLPGFDRSRVKRPQNLMQLAGDLVLGSDLTPPSEAIGETVWASRGLTYQESMLSRRCIIITESEVFYQCTELTHREGRLKSPAVGNFEFLPVASFPDLLRHCDRGYKGALFTLYRNCVKEYTNRRLSYDRDGLNAFQGMLSHLERQFGTHMVMGLPWGMMATSLVWDIRGEKLRRRREEKVVGIGATITSPLLPSWTWAAWEGQVGWGVNVDTYVERPHHWGRPVWAHDFSRVRIPSGLPATGFEEIVPFESGPGASPEPQLSCVLPIVARVMVWRTPDVWPESPVPLHKDVFWIHICDIWDKDHDTTAYCLVVEMLPYQHLDNNRSLLYQLFGREAAEAYVLENERSGKSDEAAAADMSKGLCVLKRCPANPREALRSSVWLAHRIYRASFDHDSELWTTAEFVPTLLLLG